MSCDCNTLVIGEAGVQGPQGLGGINGTNGTNGINAFTTTSEDFEQPSVGAPVTFSVVDNRWIAVGQTVYISEAGFYTVASLGGDPFSSVTANLISTDGISVGDTVTGGRQVSPSASAVYSAPLASLTVTTGGVSSLDGPVTINESGNNSDFRVEGFGDTHLLFCDANAGTTGRVGISINAPETTLHVDGSFKVGTAATPADAVFTKGATFNSEQSGSGTDGDFLIKTKNVSDTFFVDASADFVGIGTNTPSKLLDVDGAAEMNTLLVNPGGVAANPSFQVYGTNSTRPITVLSTNAPFNGVGIFKTTPTVALDVVGATAISQTLAVTGDVTVGANVLKVNSTGTFVGINKSTPTVALDVVGAVAVSGASTLDSLTVTNAASVGTTLGVSGVSTLNSLIVSTTASITGNLDVDSGVLKVDTSNNRVGVNQPTPTVALDVNGAVKVGTDLTVSDALYVINSSGFVGINEASPSLELEVNGSVKATDYRIAVTPADFNAKLTKFLYGSGSGTFAVAADSTDASIVITVDGAVVGDFVQVSYSAIPGTTPNLLTLFAYVSASDTVTVVVSNGSDTAVASQTYSVNVLVIGASLS
jgi:hypothetical protein